MKGYDRSPRSVRFEGFELDLRAGELRPEAGKTQRLPEQPFRILTMLLQQPGEVLTREDIRKELWPDNTIVEFEHSINAAMNRLRQALGDSADHPRYIETLARRGYRWMVSVDWVEVKVGPNSYVTLRHWWSWAAGFFAAIALVAGILWFVRVPARVSEATQTAVPLTTYTGFQGQPNFSPDGNQVAFTWDGENQDNLDIYVKLIGTSGPPLRLTNDPAPDYSPVWSPDGRFIAFLRALPRGRSAVLVIPALGGPERKVGEIAYGFLESTGTAPGQALGAQHLAWSPDGNWLVFSDRDTSQEPLALFLLSIETGERRRLTSPPKSLLGDGWPAFSPDARTLAFSRIVDFGLSDLYMLAMSEGFKPSGEAQRITFQNQGATSPTWTSDGHEIVFSTEVPQEALWRIAVPSIARPARPESLTSLGSNVIEPTISSRRHRMAFAHLLFHGNIWRVPTPSGPGVSKLEKQGFPTRAAPFVFSTRNDLAPQYSPNGKKIAFMSDRSGNLEIWVCERDGSNAMQLTFFGGPLVTNPSWSPDSSRIAFDSNAAGEFDVWVTSASGGKPQRMTSHPANDGNPSWSRDGRWIYFDSARTGEQQVWKIPADGGEAGAVQITRDGGFGPLESPDGKFLYYSKALYTTSLWKVPVDGGQAVKVLDSLSNNRNLAMVNSGIYFVPVRETGRGSSIQFLAFANNQIKPVASFEKALTSTALGGLGVSPDGKWLLFTQFDQDGSELMVVDNFR